MKLIQRINGCRLSNGDAAIFRYCTLSDAYDIQNNVIGSKLIMNNIEKDAIAYNPGVLGSGLLASNLSDKSNNQLLDFTRLLVGIYKNSQYKAQDGSVYSAFLSNPSISHIS